MLCLYNRSRRLRVMHGVICRADLIYAHQLYHGGIAAPNVVWTSLEAHTLQIRNAVLSSPVALRQPTVP